MDVVSDSFDKIGRRSGRCHYRGVCFPSERTTAGLLFLFELIRVDGTRIYDHRFMYKKCLMLATRLSVLTIILPVASGLAASTVLSCLRTRTRCRTGVFISAGGACAGNCGRRFRREETGNAGKDATGRCRSSGRSASVRSTSNRYICRRRCSRHTVG